MPTSKTEAQSIQKAYDLFMQAPMMIGVIRGPEYSIEVANEGLLQLWNKGPEVIGQPLFKVIPELKGQGFKELLDQVLLTGQPYNAVESPARLVRNGIQEIRYFNFTYQPFYSGNEKSDIGVFATAVDVTEQVLARKLIEESEQRFRNILDQAPDPILILRGEKLVLDVANEPLFKIWNVGKDALGKPFLEILPEMKDQPFVDLLLDVYKNGKTHNGQEVPAVFHRQGTGQETRYFNFVYEPYREKDGRISGVLVLATDVTKSVERKRAIEENQKNFRAMVEQAPVAMLVMTGEDMILQTANNTMLRLLDKTSQIIGKPLWKAVPEIKGHPVYNVLHHVYRTGEPYYGNEQLVAVMNKGIVENRYFNTACTSITEGDKVVGVIAVVTEVTEQVRARKRIEKQNQELQFVLDVMPQMVWQTLPDGSATFFNKVFLSYCGLALRDLKDHGWTSLVHHDDVERTLNGWQDSIRFGAPYQVEHRLRSHDGGYRWFLTRATALKDELGKVLKWYCTTTDINEQKQHEAILEAKVTERTAELENLNKELKNSNTNLQQFAYAASHDLKEPIRKIIMFASRLREQLSLRLADEDLQLFNKMEKASERMTTLIDSLLSYSYVSRGIESTEQLELNEIVKLVLEDLELEVLDKKASISVSKLPTIKAHKRQVQQLFQNLISNALKYSRPDAIPEIDISAKEILGKEMQGLTLDQNRGYHLIIITDNGIGFNQNDAERIFNVFTRLHRKEHYKGTGVGLSIVRKVAENHNGFVYATSSEGMGATFYVGFPVAGSTD